MTLGVGVHTAILLVTCFSGLVSAADDFLYGKFPDEFIWGTATSSYQIEGGWNVTDKGENIWDRYSHDGHVANNQTGDIACDSYNNYQQDVAILKELGVNFYRFSISWARIMPKGTREIISKEGICYYKQLLSALQAAGITPFVTLYHWDLPQALQDVGGWENETIIGHFNDYATVCFEEFGDQVKWWLTFNEPFVFCWIGLGVGAHAPGIKRPATSPYACIHTVIKAHAKAYHTYNNTFRAAQHGKIAITIDSDWKGPRNESDPDDVAASARAMRFKLGWVAQPIFGNGDYPDVMKEYVGNKSREQNYTESRLPAFTADQKAEIKGTFDFFGLNHYTTQNVTSHKYPITDESYATDSDIMEIIDPSWPTSGSSWLKMVPWGLRKLLNFIKKEYNNPPVYITENGVSDRNSSMDDQHRVRFYKAYTNEVLKAITLDKCDVKSYTAWSLMDNFEWGSGYDEKFGIFHVNFTDPRRPRKAKASARFYAKLIKDHGFPEPPRVTTRPPGGGGINTADVTLPPQFLICIIVTSMFLVF